MMSDVTDASQEVSQVEPVRDDLKDSPLEQKGVAGDGNLKQLKTGNESNQITPVLSTEDQELAQLLDSALEDFHQPPPEDLRRELELASTAASCLNPVQSTACKSLPSDESKQKDSSGSSGINFEEYSNVDDVLKKFMDSDPLLKNHWEKLAESCNRAASATTDEDFEASLSETLKNLSENAKTIAENTDMSEEELAKIWGNLGMAGFNPGAADGSNRGIPPLDNYNGPQGLMPDIMPLVTNMMQNLLSKDVLYPALKDLAAKYPEWLESNSSSLSSSELNRYSKQLDLMKKVCEEFDAEDSEDTDDVKKDRFQRILSIMQQMQECGSPPKDLVGDVPDLGSPGPYFLSDFSKIPGLNNPNGGQCCIQ